MSLEHDDINIRYRRYWLYLSLPATHNVSLKTIPPVALSYCLLNLDARARTPSRQVALFLPALVTTHFLRPPMSSFLQLAIL